MYEDEEFDYWEDDEDDPDRFCGDADWEFTKDARMWEIRRQNFAEQQIKAYNEEGALLAIKLLFQRADLDFYQSETILYIQFLFIQ